MQVDFLISGGSPGDGRDHGLRFPDPGAVAVEIDGKRYVSLPRLIELKLASGMSAPAAHFDDVIQLIRANGLAEDFGAQLHPHVQAKYREYWGYAQRPTGEY
ncbi:MAG TPA: hypothetical protein VFZ65_13170 [Planctomycetota bacterium]|nr:hypothetical protein [Planctomycetota bacterium]